MTVLGTAGHVDHGKSTLVHALTGIDPDRLREEKERGLTIDLGFAWLTLPSGREVSIVDVPGHERFIKNMLAGAGGVDLALLIVAADEGPMPQTREHLAILERLDVPRAIAVITKCDLVEPDFVDLIELETRDLLERTRFADAPLVRVSATTGEGLAELLAVVEEELEALPRKRDLGRPRLAIDRAFTVKGFGVVVTGTLVDGALETGQEVELLPGGVRARIRGLQRHRSAVTRLEPGTRAAVNLSGVRLEQVVRGMVLALPGTLPLATAADVRLAAIDGLEHSIRDGAGVTVLVATAESQGRVRLLDTSSLQRGEAWAQVVFDEPLPILAGDRLIVRSPDETLAGATVVALNPPRHRRNHVPTLVALATQLERSPEQLAAAMLESGPKTTADLTAGTGLEPAALEAFLAGGVAAGRVVRLAGRFVSPGWVEITAHRLAESVAGALAESPLQAAVAREPLRQAMRLEPAIFDAVVTAAATSGLLEERPAGLAPVGWEPKLSDAQSALAERYLAALRAGGTSPPTDSPPPPALIAFLAERGELVNVGAGVVFAADVHASMLATMREFAAANGGITLAQARDLFATSRKYAQAFLEDLDARHITRRTGDLHTFRQARQPGD